MINGLRKHWIVRSARERTALVAAVALVALVLSYRFVWIPLLNSSEQARTQVAKLERTVHNMRALSVETEKLEARRETPPRPPVHEAVSTSLQRLGLHAQVEPTEEQSVNVRFEGVAAERFFQWLELLQREQAVRVRKLEAVTLSEPGSIRASVTLGR